MSEQTVIFQGTIDSFVPMGDIIQYEGTILKPGTWTGIDGNEIHYNNPAVLKEAAPTFSGTQLVHGHHDRTQRSVRGFNSMAWFDGEAIKNRGYIFEPETVKQIKNGKYPTGQSMEARVFVDTGMNALKVLGRRVAIGLTKPAVRGAHRQGIREVRLEKMGDKNIFAEAFEVKLKEVMENEEVEDKGTAIMEIFGELMTAVDPEGVAESKYVLLTDTKFAEMKAAAETKPGTDDLTNEVNDLKVRLLAFETAGKTKQLTLLEGAIKKLDAEFVTETYLEGIDDHVMKVRMLTAYLAAYKKVAPILPATGVKDIKLGDEDLNKYAKEVYGEDFDSLVESITGVAKVE